MKSITPCYCTSPLLILEQFHHQLPHNFIIGWLNFFLLIGTQNVTIILLDALLHPKSQLTKKIRPTDDELMTYDEIYDEMIVKPMMKLL